MNAEDYMIALRAKYRWNDADIARKLHVTRQAIQNYRTFKTRGPTDKVCIRIAKLLDIDPLTVIADMNVRRSTDPDERKFWRQYATKKAKPNTDPQNDETGI